MKNSNLVTRLLPSRAGTVFIDGGTSLNSKADIASALSKAPTVSFYLTMWSILEDVDSWHPLINCAVKIINVFAVDNNWPLRMHGKKIIKQFLITALLDWTGKHQCNECGGTGYQVTTMCPLCRGKGKLKFTVIQKAIMCGVGKGHWKRDGEKYYQVVLDLIDSWEKDADKELRKQLF